MKIKYLFMTVLFVFVSHLSANAQWKKNKALEDTKIWRYDIECEGIAKQGAKLVKVWSYSKNPRHAISSTMRNAVHGIIFKGYAGGGQGCTPLRPLVNDPSVEEEYKEFFDAFFEEGGEYLKYVSAATDGSIAPGDRLKVNRREYKIGAIITVMSDELRKRLEKENIVKSLSSGF
jgi:hypothetical protein